MWGTPINQPTIGRWVWWLNATIMTWIWKTKKVINVVTTAFHICELWERKKNIRTVTNCAGGHTLQMTLLSVDMSIHLSVHCPQISQSVLYVKWNVSANSNVSPCVSQMSGQNHTWCRYASGNSPALNIQYAVIHVIVNCTPSFLPLKSPLIPNMLEQNLNNIWTLQACRNF